METDQLTVTVAAKDDEKLTFEELCERADEVTEKIAGIDGVETIGAIAGGDSALMSMGGSSDSVTMYLLLEEDSSVTTGEITAQIAELTKDMDCQVDTDNSASDMSSFLGSGITVQIKGSDLGTLQELAGKVWPVWWKHRKERWMWMTGWIIRRSPTRFMSTRKRQRNTA